MVEIHTRHESEYTIGDFLRVSNVFRNHFNITNASANQSIGHNALIYTLFGTYHPKQIIAYLDSLGLKCRVDVSEILDEGADHLTSIYFSVDTIKHFSDVKKRVALMHPDLSTNLQYDFVYFGELSADEIVASLKNAGSQHAE